MTQQANLNTDSVQKIQIVVCQIKQLTGSSHKKDPHSHKLEFLCNNSTFYYLTYSHNCLYILLQSDLQKLLENRLDKQ